LNVSTPDTSKEKKGLREFMESLHILYFRIIKPSL
jgi:hypothetical protein